MTKVNRDWRTSLPTNIPENKYFFLLNNEYFRFSSYIYICLEDNNFSLSYKSIKYCLTNTYPYSYSSSVVRHCSFRYLNYYKSESSSSIA